MDITKIQKRASKLVRDCILDAWIAKLSELKAPQDELRKRYEEVKADGSEQMLALYMQMYGEKEYIRQELLAMRRTERIQDGRQEESTEDTY